MAKDFEFRTYLYSLPHAFILLFYNKYVYMIFQYAQNLATILSGSFFFVSGTAEPNQGVGNVGFFYVFDLPFFILGLIMYFRTKFKAFQIFFLWFVASILVLALSKEVPHATRGYFLVLPMVCFIALGMFSFFSYLATQKNKLLKYALLTSFILFAFYNIQYYFLSYYFRFPVAYADAWRKEDKELSLYLKANENKYAKIIIGRNTDFVYTSYLFYSAYPPKEFTSTAKRFRDGVLLKANGWGKYEIGDVNWQKDLKIPHTLIVASEKDVPQNSIIRKKISTPTRPIVMSVNDSIISIAESKVIYVLIETDKNMNTLK